eukprot:GHVU01017419.1.p1 GENE.GHVU01017419.1~~GHVU01017419.1.p1  ORF type:complete len:209 (+),score=25.00 GHVU01017419.1:452-1078(+)
MVVRRALVGLLRSAVGLGVRLPQTALRSASWSSPRLLSTSSSSTYDVHASAAAMAPELPKTNAEWKQRIADEASYKILREKDTESAFSGEYDKFYPVKGHFKCKACSAPLYSAQAKFDSGCGWPSFDQYYEGSVLTAPDPSIPGRHRTEIICANCNSHLGHVFNGEKKTENDERHCVNSLSVIYDESDGPNAKQITYRSTLGDSSSSK